MVLLFLKNLQAFLVKSFVFETTRGAPFFRKLPIFNFELKYLSKLPCQSRWSGVIFRSIAQSNCKSLHVSSWKEESSRIIKPFLPGSSIDVAALPIFPPNIALNP